MYSPQQGTVHRKAWGHVTSHPAQLSSALSLHPASQAASSLRPAPLQCPDSQAHRLPTLGLCLLGALQPLCQWTPALRCTVNWEARGKEAGQHGLWEEAWEGSQREADWQHPYRK